MDTQMIHKKHERRTTVQWLSIHVNHENDMVVPMCCQTLRTYFTATYAKLSLTCVQSRACCRSDRREQKKEDEHPGTSLQEM